MRVLVVKLSSLGDVLHVLPAVHALRTSLDGEVDWVTQCEYVPLVECCPDVGRVWGWDRRGGWRAWRSLRESLRQVSYDWAVDFQGNLKSALVTRGVRARRKVGPAFAREGARFLYPETAGRRTGRGHAVDQWCAMVRDLGIGMGEIVFPLQFPSVSVGGHRPRVAVAPGSRWPAKNWPPDHFAAVVRRLRDETSATVYVLGSAEERPLAERIVDEAKVDGVVNLAGERSLPELGGYLQAMDLMVANDSGLAHLAAAVGTPVLGIYGPTDPSRTGPYGSQHRVLTAQVPCRPCFSRRCPDGTHACLRQITPNRVAEVALAMLTRSTQ